MPPVTMFSCPTKVYFGVDAHRHLPGIIAEFGWKRLFLLIDPALMTSEILARITQGLAECGVQTTSFSQIEPEPHDITVEAAFAQCAGHQAEAILALGGGSTIDVAKAVAILMTNDGKIADYQGIEKFSIRPLPLVAVPTTAGTGSEVSGAAVITDTARRVKMAIRHATFGPAQVAILDPLALISMPAHVAAHAGIDAFVHAFESYLSKQAHVFSDAVNIHAMKLITASLRPFHANRQNTGAALDMLTGSAMAGLSFGTTGLGNVHCMAMAVGGMFAVPHGLANAVCLPFAAAFNVVSNPQRYRDVAEIFGVDTATMGDHDAAQAALTAIGDLCRDLNIPPRLRDVGVTEDSIPALAAQAFAADYNRWNPRYTTETDFVALFQQAL